MVVRDFDFEGMAVLPSEADAVLLVDPDAVLSASISTQPLEPVRRRHRQMLKVPRVVDLIELASGYRPQKEWARGARRAGIPSVEDVLCSFVEERGYHTLCYNG